MHAHAVLAGRYELLDRLGEGRMSVLWRARDHELNRDVALKILAVPDDDRLREGIRVDVMTATQVTHPNVARLFDYGEAELEPAQPTPFVVMELLNGTTLAEVVTPLPPSRAFSVCAEIAEGLAAAHAIDVVHGDIKPGHVMLTVGGAKILGFGLAARVADDDSRPFDVAETSTYVAPERLTGGPPTPATDVYALGVLLYELLTRDIPWSAATPAAMVAAQLIDEPARLPAVPGVTACVESLYERCLDRNPAVRPHATEVAAVLAESAEAAASLARTSDTEPTWDIVGTAPMSMMRAGPEDRSMRRAVLWIVTALLVIVLVGTVVATQLVSSSTTDPAAPAAQATRGQATPTVTPGPSTTPTAETASEPAVTDASPTEVTTPPNRPSQRSFTSSGGAIVAGCYNDQAYLLSWQPTEGYQVKKLVQGPGSYASVELKRANAEVVMTVTCEAGSPVLTLS